MIAAILQAQFRSLRFGRGSALTAVARAIWYGIWIVAACASGWWAAVANLSSLDRILSPALMGVCLYWQLIPLLSASMGASIDLRKLMAYPIPHRKLFLVEVLLRFTNGAEMVLVLIGGAVGVLANPAVRGWVAAARVVSSFLIFVLFNLLLASGLRSILERLLARRHVRELVAFLMAMVGVVPRFFLQTGIRPKWVGPSVVALQAVGLPWTAAAHAAITHGASQSAMVAGISLAGWTLLAAWFGHSQFERNLRYDPQAAQTTPVTSRSVRTQSVVERLFRFPSLLWRDPLAGMVEKELRSLTRTPRFRMVFVMGFTFGVMLWLPMILGRGSHPTASRYFLTIVCVYSLTLLGGVTYWNCFGFDRSAAAFYFAAPLPVVQVVVAKNIVALIFIYLEVAILSGITVLLRTGVGVAQIVETAVVMGICALYMLALGNVSSMRSPRALNPERVSQGSGGRGMQALLLVLYPLALIPVLLAYVARYAFSSQLAFAIVLALAAAIGGVMYKIGLDSAVSAATTHREHLLGELSKGDGPLVSG
jgi:ABC-2 type transport system permease protein